MFQIFTYLDVKQRPARMAQSSPRYTNGAEALLDSVLLDLGIK